MIFTQAMIVSTKKMKNEKQEMRPKIKSLAFKDQHEYEPILLTLIMVIHDARFNVSSC